MTLKITIDSLDNVHLFEESFGKATRVFYRQVGGTDARTVYLFLGNDVVVFCEGDWTEANLLSAYPDAIELGASIIVGFQSV